MHRFRVFKELKCKGAHFCSMKWPCGVLGIVTLTLEMQRRALGSLSALPKVTGLEVDRSWMETWAICSHVHLAPLPSLRSQVALESVLDGR